MTGPQRATDDEFIQAQIDAEYLKGVYGNFAKVNRATGISDSTFSRLMQGTHPLSARTAQRIRQAAAEAERTAPALGGNGHAPRNGTLDHALSAAAHIDKAADELRLAALSAPAISALGFGRGADILVGFREKYLDDLLPK
jgi:hypothetical protein